MSEGERWIIVCQDAKDGSGDVIVDLPPELLSRMGIGIGDDLAISVVNCVIELRPVHGIGAMSVRPVLAGAMRDGFYHAYRVLLVCCLTNKAPDACETIASRARCALFKMSSPLAFQT